MPVDLLATMLFFGVMLAFGIFELSRTRASLREDVKNGLNNGFESRDRQR